jgi:hypothetical protein
VHLRRAYGHFPFDMALLAVSAYSLLAATVYLPVGSVFAQGQILALAGDYGKNARSNAQRRIDCLLQSNEFSKGCQSWEWRCSELRG